MSNPEEENNNTEFGVLHCLTAEGFDPHRRSKFVRHQHDRYPVRELLRREWFELYQRYQSRPVLDDADYLVAFSGEPGTEPRFQGVYRVLGHRPAAEGPTPPDCPWAIEWKADCVRKGGHFYDLERDQRFDALRGRLIMDWGPGTRQWCQNAKDRPVLQIDRPGRSLRPFGGYEEILLTHRQLCELAQNETAHPDWSAALKAVGGVYLILAETSGEQYVGSATGVAGVWGRWREYARSGHCGNALLSRLIGDDAAYPGAFTFSLHEVCPQDMETREGTRMGSFPETQARLSSAWTQCELIEAPMVSNSLWWTTTIR